MDLSSSAELKAFDATARSGSMSAAARLLGIRQPTVSAHIAGLEKRFGVELFVRRGRGVELTTFGHALHEVSNRIYRAEQQAAMLLLSARSQYEGHLKICAVGPYNVLPMVKQYRGLFPKIRLAVSVGDSRQIVEKILDHRDDVGVLLHAVDDERVHCVPYRRQALIVFAAAGHPLAAAESVTLSDLEGQEFVLREHGSQTRSVFEAGLAAAGVRVRSSVEMGSRESVREAVAQGLGLGVVAETAFVPDARLVVLPIQDLQLSTHVHVICLAERRSAPLIAGFLAVVDKLKVREDAPG
ncbi:MAG TPA: LysR substrate-binding domain-containing protein [Polaromonas sp.]|uniref:LysR substrate-binding domain-containing protein n=1 Tax=Polaromonas sp. TaxID=1869339 RepID=UPI002D6C0B5C|nr:LysR substrate-binding domain-containing protein [Polaromonas sp.]HYW56082.1 LysR substrate-binding domain-containing protein [Polaromonas sp.]